MTQKNREAIARAEGMLLGASYIVGEKVADFILGIAEDLSGVLDSESAEPKEIVQCKDCVLHGECVTENTFKLSGVDNPFCCVGVRKVVADDD